MARHLLSIRILLHVTFAFVYLPVIFLAFGSGGHSSGPGNSFVYEYYDGIVALAALAGLGIFAALDTLTIRRKVNQRAFLAIEILVVVLMPLSMWPIIISGISVIWSDWFSNLYIKQGCRVAGEQLPRICNFMVGPVVIVGDTVTSAAVIAATVAILGLNTAFVLYICIPAVIDKVRGRKFLPVYPGESSLSSPGPRKKWYLFGTQRTPTERAAMVSQCADYMFRNSVFRKHAFEPTGWAIFRGIMAVYSCIGLVFFSAYSGYAEGQLHSNDISYTVKETMLAISQCRDVALEFDHISVTAYMADVASMSFWNPTIVPDTSLSAVLSPDSFYSSTAPGVWAATEITLPGLVDFNLSWTGNYSLVMWVTSADTICFLNSTQVDLTSPLILAPFKQYSMSLTMIKYKLNSLGFLSYRPDHIGIVDSGSESNISTASFSFNNYCQPVVQRDLSPPSVISSMATVISSIGGMLSFIDGIFALIFGRAIVAILFGSRIISPFGLLGMVSRNRFKRLIHEQYPRMLEDIERGGMAAYISEVAIDAALVDRTVASPSKRPTGSPTSYSGYEAGEGDAIHLLRPLQTGSYLRLPHAGNELGDYERNTLAYRKTDDE